jgi:hypothetical protein
MQIEHISFGKLVAHGKVVRSDCIVYKDRVNSRWWRKNGTYLEIDDLQDVIHERPESIIVGIGFMNLLTVSEQVIHQLKEHGIDVIVDKTPEAVERYNELINKKNVVGVFHVI